MANDSVKYNFFYFGNSDWFGLPNREHHIAFSFAKDSHNVFFIEKMPSIAKKSRIFFSSTKANIPYYTKIPTNLKIITPPIIPTFFRSSFTPKLDQKIFLNWFRKEIKSSIRSLSVAIISTPVWFYLFQEEIECFDFVIYDLYDDLKVSARNKHALRYLINSEKLAARKSNLITCSTPVLQNYIYDKYGLSSVLIRNGVDESFICNVNSLDKSKKIIGLVGAIDVKPDIYDIQLIGKIAERFYDYEIRIIGRVNKKQMQYFNRFSNINCKGIITGNNLKEEISQFALCIIPFLSTKVSASVNPLKLYEYLACGKPVVVTDNFDYDDAKEIIYITKTHVEFIQSLNLALRE